MTAAAPQHHLTGDELDALLAGTSPARVASHLETCGECRTLVAADRDLVDAIARLPLLEPAPGFEQRVMARVSVVGAGEAVVAVPGGRVAAARRRALWGGLAVGGSVAAGLGWAALHPAAAADLASPVVGRTGHALWLSLQRLTDTAHSLGWMTGIRGAIATPLRAMGIATLAAATYAAALGGLGRLLAEPAPHARW